MLQFQAEGTMELRGVVPVDKPVGVSSHTVVSWARKHLDLRKVGHTGTLDPLASGLLILLIGKEATVQQDAYLKLDKEYVCSLRLGVTTDTLDCTGSVTGRHDWNEVETITEQQVITVLQDFVGSQLQMVPLFSAVRVGGKRLYDVARKGKPGPAKRPERTVTIFALTLESFNKNLETKQLEVTVRVACSSGTYIRVLADSIGKALHVGATVTALRRTKIGDLTLETVQLCPLIPKQFYLFEKLPVL